jgi:hypothetical protein
MHTYKRACIYIHDDFIDGDFSGFEGLESSIDAKGLKAFVGCWDINTGAGGGSNDFSGFNGLIGELSIDAKGSCISLKVAVLFPKAFDDAEKPPVPPEGAGGLVGIIGLLANTSNGLAFVACGCTAVIGNPKSSNEPF